MTQRVWMWQISSRFFRRIISRDLMITVHVIFNASRELFGFHHNFLKWTDFVVAWNSVLKARVLVLTISSPSDCTTSKLLHPQPSSCHFNIP